MKRVSPQKALSRFIGQGAATISGSDKKKSDKTRKVMKALKQASKRKGK